MVRKQKKEKAKKRGFIDVLKSLSRGTPEVPDINEKKVKQPSTETKNQILPNQTISQEANIEKIKTELEMLKDFRNADENKINSISGQIGELRSLFFEKEKKIRKVEAKAEKASDLVQAMKPKKVMKGLARYDVRLTKIETKNESIKVMINEVF